MKPMLNQRATGILDRRPSASRMPSGNEAAMPTLATTRVTSSPPQYCVSTTGNPKMPPVSNQ
jgi:hypothetical protein